MFNYKYVEVLQIFLNNTNVPVDNLLLFRQMTKQVWQYVTHSWPLFFKCYLIEHTV